MTDKINIPLKEYNSLLEQRSEFRSLLYETCRKLIAVKKNVEDLEDELITETKRANEAEERTARYEKPEEAIDLAQDLVAACENYIGLEELDESIGLYTIRRLIEDFKRVAGGKLK